MALCIVATVAGISANVNTYEQQLSVCISKPSTAMGDEIAVTIRSNVLNATGYQVELLYDMDKLAYLDESAATSQGIRRQSIGNDFVNTTNIGMIRFVSSVNMKNTTVYKKCGNLFMVRFTAKTTISDTTKLFSLDKNTTIIGDATTLEIPYTTNCVIESITLDYWTETTGNIVTVHGTLYALTANKKLTLIAASYNPNGQMTDVKVVSLTYNGKAAVFSLNYQPTSFTLRLFTLDANSYSPLLKTYQLALE